MTELSLSTQNQLLCVVLVGVHILWSDCLSLGSPESDQVGRTGVIQEILEESVEVSQERKREQ